MKGESTRPAAQVHDHVVIRRADRIEHRLPINPVMLSRNARLVSWGIIIARAHLTRLAVIVQPNRFRGADEAHDAIVNRILAPARRTGEMPASRVQTRPV